MNPTDVKSVIDVAAQQNDRWLFIALLVIGLLAIWMLAKYFTGKISALESKHDDLNKFVRDELTSIVASTEAAITANTTALHEIRELKLSQQNRPPQ